MVKRKLYLKVDAKWDPSMGMEHMGEVRQQLEQKGNLNTTEKVGVDVPTTWSSQIIVMAKPDGKLRRIIDFKNLNMPGLRQTDCIESPC